MEREIVRRTRHKNVDSQHCREANSRWLQVVTNRIHSPSLIIFLSRVGGWGRVLEYAEIWRSVLQVCVVQTTKNTLTLRLDFDTVSCQ